MAGAGAPTRRPRLGADRRGLAARSVPAGVPRLPDPAAPCHRAGQVRRDPRRGLPAAAQRGLGEMRTSMRDLLEPEAIEGAVETWERELARLSAVRRSVKLVEEALRGRRFRARL